MPEAIFLRLLETVDKATGLAEVTQQADARRFCVDTDMFERVPGSPMAYWVRPNVLRLFQLVPAAESNNRQLRRGAGTNDDFRFLRLSWEHLLNISCGWVCHAKGGGYSPYFYDLHLALQWNSNGKELKAFFENIGEHPSRNIRSENLYLRPGLTWPLRTQKGLSLRVMPAGCIFGSKGPAAFVANDQPTALLALLAITNSAPFRALVNLQMAFGSYEVGVIQQTPVPNLSPQDENALSTLALQAWTLKRQLDTATENSHAFSLPALLQVMGTHINDRVHAYSILVQQTETHLATIQADIDNRCFALYGIDAADRASIERGFGPPSDDGPDEEEEVEASNGDTVADLISWAIGVTFGRFDLSLATGHRALPAPPDPFAPLPACAPGMLCGADGLPLATPPPAYPIAFPTDGILVDDPGADRDLLTHIRQVFDGVFGEAGDDRLGEATDILDPKAPNLRRWLRSQCFESHIQQYSKSRRKAPIYWRLGTPSGSYSVWLYIHRAGPDMLHAILRDHVEPKLRFEINHLATLQTEAGDSPAPSQRKGIDIQQNYVDELSTFRDELRRIAPLWNPNLDDGVVINASFLHRLFAHTRAWQKECEEHWEALLAGKYDWAHLAMRLWPERVVPQCAEDRSLAIAHGLEATFWVEQGGKWSAQEVSEADIEALIKERTSPAVKDALKQLGNAPAPAKNRVPRKAAAPAPRPAEPVSTQVTMGLRITVDATVLETLRGALRRFPDGAGKTELLVSTGLEEGVWMSAMEALVERGEVVRTGKGRGLKYMGREVN